MEPFKDSRGNVVSLEDIVKQISGDFEYEVYVGSDSQVHRKIKKIVYTTCIILYKKGKGGKIFLSKEKDRRPSSLREKLTMEVWRSIETAFKVYPLLPKNAELVIHIDVNKNKKFKSNAYLQELVGMVVGQGFKVVAKPSAWAAQSVADKFSK